MSRSRLGDSSECQRITKETHIVLTLTENASTVVKTIVDQSGGDPQAGLRISQDAVDSPALHVTATEAPQPGDQVLEEDGARVFLEETAAETLDDKVLDAQVDDSGGVQFTLAVRPAG
jgi:Fe-S cluster assembly iron-binding protein IscA